MAIPIINFPFSAVVDGLLNYLQWAFGNPRITPSDFRWNSDGLQSKIKISGTFVIDSKKPMSSPFVVVERGPFQFDNRMIDNVKDGTANTFENITKTAIANGYVNVIIGSGVAGEASSIANFIAVLMQDARHGIMNQLHFLRNFYHLDLGPEIPVVKYAEVHRWEVTLRFFTSIQLGWYTKLIDPKPWNSATIYTENANSLIDSTTGSMALASDLLIDTTKDFGFNTSNNPQFLQAEFTKGWYYVRFTDDPTSFLYPISEIVDNHTLRIVSHDAENNHIPYSAPVAAHNISYEIKWNNLHIKLELPTS